LVMALDEYGRTKRDGKFSVIVLDRKGRDYADLPRLLGSHWRHYDVHSTLRLGTGGTSNIPTDYWINHFTRNFCTRAGLVAGRITMASLMRYLVGLMNETGARRPLFPSFRLMLEALHRMPKHRFATKDPYVDSLVQWLMDVTHGTGNLYDAFIGLSLQEDLIAKGLSAVISMPQMSPDWISHLMADSFIDELLLDRSFRGHLVDRPDTMLLIDEGDDDVNYENERKFTTSKSPISRGMRELREFGVGVCFGVGALNLLGQDVINAARYKMVMTMDFAPSVNMAAATLMLPPGAEAIIPALPAGCGLFRSKHWRHPLLTKVDYVPPYRGGVPTFDHNPHVPSKTLDEIPAFAKALSVRSSRKETYSAEEVAGEMKGLRPEARNLLVKASLHPYWPVHQLYKLGDVPAPQTQFEIRKELKDHGYAEFEQARIGKRDVLMMMLTAAAQSMVGEPPLELRGRGGITAKHIGAWIRMVGEARSYAKSVVEWVIPGTNHPADAAWLTDRQWQVFEVVVECAANLAEHVAAALLQSPEPVAGVTIVATQDKLLKPLRSAVESSTRLWPVLDKVSYSGAEVYLKELWP